MLGGRRLSNSRYVLTALIAWGAAGIGVGPPFFYFFLFGVCLCVGGCSWAGFVAAAHVARHYADSAAMVVGCAW